MKDIARRNASLAQLAMLLEASAPKPGNVNRLERFSDTAYRHFLASAALAGSGFGNAARQGVRLASDRINPSEVGLGDLILRCVRDCLQGINRSNTVFGSILLYVPLLTSASAALAQESPFSITKTSSWLRRILDATTVGDTVSVYRALHIAGPKGSRNKESPSWTDIHTRYDVDNPAVLGNIKEDSLRLIDLFRLAAPVDEISREWSEYFRLTCDEVYPMVKRESTGLDDIEEAIVKTFIWLLSRRPDGLIVRKAGAEQAEHVRRMAEDVALRLSSESDTSQILLDLDRELRRDGNLLNPGTTADIVSAAVFCRLLDLSFQ